MPKSFCLLSKLGEEVKCVCIGFQIIIDKLLIYRNSILVGGGEKLGTKWRFSEGYRGVLPEVLRPLFIINRKLSNNNGWPMSPK